MCGGGGGGGCVCVFSMRAQICILLYVPFIDLFTVVLVI